MSSTRRSAVLLAIFLALVGYYAWTLVSGPGSGVGAVSSRRGGAPPVRRLPTADVAELATGELELKPGVYQSSRDLFSYEQARPQPPRPRPQPPPPTPTPAEEPRPAAETAPLKPQPPPVDVSYLGSFGRPGRRIAVFTDGDAVYNALVGDVIKDKFILVSIGYESADLGFVGFPAATPSRLPAGKMR